MSDWANDSDWCAIAQNAAHPQHHIGIDRFGNYYCRECSQRGRGMYMLRDDEIKRLLLMDRYPDGMPTTEVTS